MLTNKQETYMLTVKYENLLSPTTLTGLRKLMACQDLDVRSAYRVAKVIESVERELKTAKPLIDTMIDKHKDDAEGLKAEQEKLKAIEVKIEQLPLTLSDLGGAKLSPAEILSLEWMLEA